MVSQLFVILISGVLIFLGFLGAILPLLPGPPLAFAGLLLYGFWTHFRSITTTALIIFGALTLLTMVFDIVAPALAAKGYKASRYGIIGAFVGTIFGMFLLFPIGLILGPLIGGLVGEYSRWPNIYRAWRTAWASFLGFIFSTLLRLVVTLAMAGYFVYSLLK